MLPSKASGIVFILSYDPSNFNSSEESRCRYLALASGDVPSCSIPRRHDDELKRFVVQLTRPEDDRTPSRPLILKAR